MSANGQSSSQSQPVDLMEFLKQGLSQVEQAQGHEDDELRQKLKQLQDLLKTQEEIKSNKRQDATNLSDLEIAAHIDNLEQQMNSFEHQLAQADEGTMKLFSRGAGALVENTTVSNDENNPPNGSR
eukprot:TRINITY_DN2895_c0_g1_i7.p2 TRINITY_DN2895_c0_g1~~TRINITY_DN2895_c0_g1_i7.p2  ORF type:complete len:146 (-),score=20.28 TRINITY_DN2895_c0_g1_i7:213-590(-)